MEDLDSKLKSPNSRFFLGVLRTNSRLRQVRAYITVNGLNLDVLVEGYKNMNRAMDGDTVMIEMSPVSMWIELGESKKAVTNGEYTNEQAIESRVGVDYKGSAQREDEAKKNGKNGQNNHSKKGKKNSSRIYDEIEGYAASNSDNNNLELTKKVIKRRIESNEKAQNKIETLSNSDDEKPALYLDL